jgi:hypothetical protein
MAGFTGKREFGLFDNGQAQNGTNSGFTAYAYTTADSVSGDGCFHMNYNSYGSGTQGSQYVKVDASKYYTFSMSYKTQQRSYNNRLGSGHLGFGCYDKNKSFISHHHVANNLGAQLTRAASPGDTVFYIDRGDWRAGGSGHTISCNFFPSTQTDFDTVRAPGKMSKVSIYSSAWTSITSMGGGEWRVNLTSGKSVPSGHSYPIGTWVYQTQAGGSYNYALGAPTYPETWYTHSTGVFGGNTNSNSGAGFRWGTEYIRFLNLRNYNYRTEQAGDSARYYFDNIMLLKVKPPTKVQKAGGHNYNQWFANSTNRSKFSSVIRFKRKRRGILRKGD